MKLGALILALTAAAAQAEQIDCTIEQICSSNGRVCFDSPEGSSSLQLIMSADGTVAMQHQDGDIPLTPTGSLSEGMLQLVTSDDPTRSILISLAADMRVIFSTHRLVAGPLGQMDMLFLSGSGRCDRKDG